MTKEADPMDQATRRQEEDTERAIQHQRQRSVENALVAVGVCHFCESEVPGTDLFCDKDCRDDWEKEQYQRRISGKG